MDLSYIRQNLPQFLQGAELTALLAAASLLGAAVGGLVVVAGRRSRSALIRVPTLGFIELMRNTPVLVQIFILYFGLPSVGLYPSAFASAAFALIAQNSAYVGEIYRAGIESVHRAQTEAALSLGMMPRAALIRIILPQAIPRVLPVLGSQAVAVLKDTSIASTVAVAELTHTGKLLLDRSAAPYEVFSTVGLFYLALSALLLGSLKLLSLRFPVRL